MSLAIDPSQVTDVLLADGWHEVTDLSFDLDSYEYVERTEHDALGMVLHGGGQSGICATGFRFNELIEEDGEYLARAVAGPLTSVLAVRTL